MGDYRLGQRQKMAGHALHSSPVEEVAAVLQRGGQAVTASKDGQRQVKWRAALFGAQVLQYQARRPVPGSRSSSQLPWPVPDESGLKQR